MTKQHDAGTNAFVAGLAGPQSEAPVQNDFPIKHGVLDRLRCIEVVLWWEGAISASNLCHWYGITRRKASQDFALLRQRNPGAFEYNPSSKKFEITDYFSAKFCQASEDEYIQHLKRCMDLSADIEEVTLNATGLDLTGYPRPRTPPGLFRSLLWAIRAKSALRLTYLDASDEEKHPTYHEFPSVTPLQLVDTHAGWHLRCYDHDRNRFRLLRVNRVFGDPQPLWEKMPTPRDWEWEAQKWLVGEPRLDLSPAESALLCADWGISQQNPLLISVRQCLAGLVLHYWQRVETRLQFKLLESNSADWLVDPYKEEHINAAVAELGGL